MVKLCSYCKERNRTPLPECPDSECFVCRGASAKLEKMADEAAGKIPQGWKSFAVSTNVPREMMAREEAVWDYGLGRSVKDDFNRRIVAALAERTGLGYDFVKADGKVVFDFAKGEARLENADLFVYGKYKKFRSDIAQSEWTCKNCNGKGCEECDFEGVKYDSVEVIIGNAAKALYGAKDAELHSSGREDVDALNLAGRPFVLELRKPDRGKLQLKALADAVNTRESGVEITDLQYVSNGEVALVSDSHFDKAYEAEMEVEGGFAHEDAGKIMALAGSMLSQRTPHRVKHRRSDLVRKRRILGLRILGEKPPKIYVLAEAGTYIKEFISGDAGRTEPSVSGALGKKAKCIKLSVVEIRDGFLGDVLGY
ncbi:tRNA pseudouridine synthase Pus10 [uncultured archaeon]|nr:tRNA pseudouridine synthase Pus10 [uncultured archaeon]